MAQDLDASFSPSKILVPIDFSPSSDVALKTATELARYLHAHLYLLHVIPMLPIVSGVEYPTRFYPEQEFLQGAVDKAKQRLVAYVADIDSQDLRADSSVEIGDDVAGKIMMVIEREGTDFVVLSTHGISGWRPMIFGSIAEKLTKLVQCPLLLLRSAKTTTMPQGRK